MLAEALGSQGNLGTVLNLILKLAIAEVPEMVRFAIQKCLDEGFFREV